MPIKKVSKSGSKGTGKSGKFELTSPNSGKVLAQGSKKAVQKRAGQIAYFRGKSK